MRSTSVVLLAFLGACSEGGPAPDETGTERAPILDGSMSGPEDDAVVHVYSTTPTTNTSRACSGALLASNVLATAQHCVSDFTDGRFSCTADGDLSSSSNDGEMGMLLEPGAIQVRLGERPDLREPPAAVGTRIFAPSTTTICRNDIALVVLDRAIEGIVPFPVRLSTSVEPGESLRVVGYGHDELRQVGIRHVRAGVGVSFVGDNVFRPDGDSIAPRSFQTASVACPGDSGGPAFAESGALVGVFSLVVGGMCDAPRARNVFTQTSPFAADIIRPAFEAAGATPILEPGGSGGSSGSASTSGGESGEGGVGAESGSGSGGTGGAGAGAGGSPEAGSGTAGAQAGSSADPDRRGLRQRGGCRCEVPGGTGSDPRTSMSVAIATLALTVMRRRRAPLR